MPETFPNPSVSDRVRAVQSKVDQLLVTIDECRAEIDELLDSLRFPEPAPAAPAATDSAPPSSDASTEPEPTAPVDPAEIPLTSGEAVPTEPANAVEGATPESVPPAASDVPAA